MSIFIRGYLLYSMLYMCMYTGILAGFVFGVKSQEEHMNTMQLCCATVHGVNGRTKVKLALQNSTAVTWWHGFVKHMFTYHLDCVSLHTSYCYRTEDIPAVQEEVDRSTLRATVLNMTKIIGESDTSISRLQWEKKKSKNCSHKLRTGHMQTLCLERLQNSDRFC